MRDGQFLRTKRAEKLTSGRQDEELPTPILFPSGFAVAGIYRAVFAERSRFEARGIDAQADEVFAQSQGSAFTQRPVVLLSPTFVTMPSTRTA